MREGAGEGIAACSRVFLGFVSMVSCLCTSWSCIHSGSGNLLVRPSECPGDAHHFPILFNYFRDPLDCLEGCCQNV